MNADLSERESRDPETFAVIGAAMEVHRELNHGMLEAVYQDALEAEFRLRGIAFEREKLLRVHYKGQILNSYFKADFVCYGGVVVECKALSQIGGVEDAQVINYLRITRHERAVLLNFGTPSLQYKRLIFSQKDICVNLRICPYEAPALPALQTQRRRMARQRSGALEHKGDQMGDADPARRISATD